MNLLNFHFSLMIYDLLYQRYQITYKLIRSVSECFGLKINNEKSEALVLGNYLFIHLFGGESCLVTVNHGY